MKVNKNIITADTTFSIVNPKAGAHSFTLIIEMDTFKTP